MQQVLHTILAHDQSQDIVELVQLLLDEDEDDEDDEDVGVVLLLLDLGQGLFQILCVQHDLDVTLRMYR